MSLPLTTNVPPPSFTDRGFIPQTDDAILTGLQQDIQGAFGGNLNFDDDQATPQGQLANSEAAIVANMQAEFCKLTQQMDPAFNSGRFQDAIARIYYLTRNPALPTVVVCDCVGVENTVIPAGSKAVDESGNIYFSMDNAVIGISGAVSVQFACEIAGPISCPAGTLNRIYTAVPGWDTVNNPADGALGQNVESRQAFEARRTASVAQNSRGTIQAIVGAVWSVDGVLDVFGYQNDTDNTFTYRGVTLAPHSIYVAVVGGTNEDVAKAIWSKKSPGCSYTGDTTVTVEDTSAFYTPPYPSYDVTFTRPDDVAIKFAVSISNGPDVPADAVEQIQTAIINAFAGEDGGPRAQIGTTIYASRYICPVRALGDWVRIITLQIGRSTANQNSVTLDIDEAPVTSAADIAVTIV
jgi:uncharacterized phage protein gp47/JayE